MMQECAKHKGYGENTHIQHAIGDGATWIAEQFEEQFGTNHRFHVDIFHVCVYLAAAVKSSTMDEEQRQQWLAEQKENLRQSKIERVLEILEKLKTQHRESAEKSAEKEAIEIAQN